MVAADSSPLPPAFVFDARRAGATVESCAEDAVCALESQRFGQATHAGSRPTPKTPLRLSSSLGELPVHRPSPITVSSSPPTLRTFLAPRNVPRHESLSQSLLSQEQHSQSTLPQSHGARDVELVPIASAQPSVPVQRSTETAPRTAADAAKNTACLVATEVDACYGLVAAAHADGLAAAAVNLGHPRMVACTDASTGRSLPVVYFLYSAEDVHAAAADANAFGCSLVTAAQSHAPGATVLLGIVRAQAYAARLEADANRAFRARLQTGARVSDGAGAGAWHDAEARLWMSLFALGVHVHHFGRDEIASSLRLLARAAAWAPHAHRHADAVGFAPSELPKSAASPAAAWAAVLEQIPRVTSSVADAIVARYPTADLFFAALAGNTLALEDIVMSNGRPIGPVLSRRILRAFTSSSHTVI